MNRFLISAFLILQSLGAFGIVTDSVGYPRKDYKMPYYSSILSLIATNGKIGSVNELRAKPTILIYWAKYCVSCISSFPKYNQLEKQHRTKINIVLVAPDDSSHRQIYQTYKDEMGLDILSIFDSVVFHNRISRLTPHTLWIDRDGFVRDESVGISEEQILDFLDGMDANRIFNPVDPSNEVWDGDENILYRSELYLWKEGMERNGINIIGSANHLREFKVEFLKRTMKHLYKLAYLGTSTSRLKDYAFEPIYETRDSNKFENDEWFYSYKLKVPPEKATKHSLMLIMQNDLKNYFGYNGSIEAKSYPCLYLVASKGANMNTVLSKSESQERITSPTIMNLKKVRFSEVLEHINYVFHYRPIIINKTGLDDDTLVDIELNGAVYHLDHLKKELQSKYGLELKKGTTTLMTLVISDSI